MSELLDRAKASLEGVDPYTPWEVEPFSHASFGVYAADSLLASCPRKATAEFIAAARQLVPELIEAVEYLEQAADHWKSLWQGTVEDSTKVIQERDEALRALDKVTESWKRLLAEGATDE